MKTPWSITTTTRSPYRLRDQLRVLKDNFVDSEWNDVSQIDFQIALIQHRLYGLSSQFLHGLSEEHTNIYTNFSHNLTFQEATEIFNSKNYTDPAMRGRQSFNPFNKFGFVRLQGHVLKMTDLGEHFLSDDYNLAEIFFRVFLKWQLPTLGDDNTKLQSGYDVKPFLATLHLIKNVNLMWDRLGNKPVGVLKREFTLFAPTLVNFSDIKSQAQKIIDLRLAQQGKEKQEQNAMFDEFQQTYAADFLENSDVAKIKKLLSNLKDYGDNAIRYFRLTNYLYVRGNGFYIDLEPRRSVEIEALLSHDDARAVAFQSNTEYVDYISDIVRPQLPWETPANQLTIIEKLIEEIQTYQTPLRKRIFTSEQYQTMTSE